MVDIELKQLENLLDAVRRKEGWSWLLEMLLHVQTRMVHGDVTRRAKQFKLGIVKREYINEWFAMMTPNTVRYSKRLRRTREKGGNNDQDNFVHVRFIGDNVANVPVAPKGWNKFDFEEKYANGRPSDWYRFSLDDIVLSYNCDTSMLEASFTYSVKSVKLVGCAFQWADA
ncbi:hypothetical protein AKO1_015546 [Acrasis kona]|uniref:Uncharacterized protein n=1 Tax=Acrasis kona TaxID=1008807 RepID=A0AAW2ZEZ9_9EUKA